MKEIPLTTRVGRKHFRKYVAIVDDEDYEKLSKHNWYAIVKPCTVYAARQIRLPNGRQRSIQMHREILQCPKGLFVDHINHNGLDNQRSNIRLCTKLQNGWNMRVSSRNKSGYKGVCWHKPLSKWRATIRIDGKNRYIGDFTDILEAKKAYDTRALELRGEFVCLD